MLPTPVVPLFVASLISTIWIDTTAVPSRDVKPQLDQWCRVTSLSEPVGPLGTRQRRYLGRVTSLDGGILELRDVVEDEWTICGPVSWRKLPFLSRLTTCEASVRKLKSCRLADHQILTVENVTDSEAALDRNSIVKEGDQLVRLRIGIIIEDETDDSDTDE